MSAPGPDSYRVSSRELGEILTTVLSRHLGENRRICCLRRRVSAYASSTRIENVDVVLDHGRRVSLILKDLSPGARLDAAKRVRPAFLYDPLREIETYRGLLANAHLGTARYYGHKDDAAAGRCLLFLERVRGPLLWQVGELKAWEQAAAWLARMHSRLLPSNDPGGSSRKRLLEYDEQFYRTWLQRAEDIVRGEASAPPDARAGFRRLMAGYDRVINHLAALPRTVIHGEFYPSNVILRANRQRRRTCPIDWELVAHGPGIMDVAALLSGNWSDAQKTRVLRAYRAALEPSHGQPPSLEELTTSLAYAQLHLSVQMLGWAGPWTPPPAHQQNWLQSALRLAETLALR